jgi:hypothetical protein
MQYREISAQMISFITKAQFRLRARLAPNGSP